MSDFTDNRAEDQDPLNTYGAEDVNLFTWSNAEDLSHFLPDYSVLPGPDTSAYIGYTLGLGGLHDVILPDTRPINLDNVELNRPIHPYVEGLSTAGEPWLGCETALQGGMGDFPTADDAMQKQPQECIASSSGSQDDTMLFSNHPVQNYASGGDYHVSATPFRISEPTRSLRTHPPWPCNTSYAPCLLFTLPSQLVSQPVMVFMGYPSMMEPTVELGPSAGSTLMPLPDQYAPGYGLTHNLAPNHYASSYAPTSLPGSLIPSSSSLSSTHPQTSQATGEDKAILPTEQSLNTLTQAPLSHHANRAIDGYSMGPPASTSNNDEGLSTERTRYTRIVSQQPTGASRTQRTLLPKP